MVLNKMINICIVAFNIGIVAFNIGIVAFNRGIVAFNIGINIGIVAFAKQHFMLVQFCC